MPRQKIYLDEKSRLKANAKITKAYRKRKKLSDPDYYKKVYAKRKEIYKNAIWLSDDMLETLTTACSLDTTIKQSMAKNAKIETFIDNLFTYWMENQNLKARLKAIKYQKAQINL
jgi:hypothetical protein